MPLIMNTAAHFRELPPPHNKRKGLKALKPHTLYPGPNEVGDDEWAEAMQLPVIVALVEEGVLVEIKPAGKTKAAKTLSDLKPKQAIKVVTETTDVALLESWKDGAPQDVTKAINDRIDELKAPPK